MPQCPIAEGSQKSGDVSFLDGATARLRMLIRLFGRGCAVDHAGNDTMMCIEGSVETVNGRA